MPPDTGAAKALAFAFAVAFAAAFAFLTLSASSFEAWVNTQLSPFLQVPFKWNWQKVSLVPPVGAGPLGRPRSGDGDLDPSLRADLSIFAFSSAGTSTCAKLHAVSLFLQPPWLKK